MQHWEIDDHLKGSHETKVPTQRSAKEETRDHDGPEDSYERILDTISDFYDRCIITAIA